MAFSLCRAYHVAKVIHCAECGVRRQMVGILLVESSLEMVDRVQQRRCRNERQEILHCRRRTALEKEKRRLLQLLELRAIRNLLLKRTREPVGLRVVRKRRFKRRIPAQSDDRRRPARAWLHPCRERMVEPPSFRISADAGATRIEHHWLTPGRVRLARLETIDGK